MPLSDGWRLNKSHLPEMEMALVLRALRKVVGTMAPDEVNVTYTEAATRTDRDKAEVYINPTTAITGDWPLLAEKFDVLVGLASHEAGHRYFEIINIDTVGSLVKEILQRTPATGKYLHGWQLGVRQNIDGLSLHTFVAIGEEVYVDHSTARHFPIQGAYVWIARQHELKPVEWDKVILSLENLLTHSHVYNQPIPLDVLGTVDPMVWSIMDSFYKNFRIVDMGVKERELLYAKTWVSLLVLEAQKEQQQRTAESLKTMEARKPTPPTSKALSETGFEATPQAVQNEEQTPAEKREEKRLDLQGKGLIMGEDFKGLARLKLGEAQSPTPTLEEEELITTAMEMADDSNVIDMLEKINDVLDHDIKSRGVLVESQHTDVMARDYNSQLSKDLLGLERIKNATGNETRRAVSEGRLDRRRLARHAISDRIMRKTVKKVREKLDLILLLDASGSMHSHVEIYKNSRAIFDANLSGTTHAYSYNSSRGRGSHGYKKNEEFVSIKHITWDGQFHTIALGGSTPSGEGLIAVSLKHPNSLIIHFTDGAPNNGRTVEDAAQAILRDNDRTLVLNIILGSDRDSHPGIPDVYRNMEGRRFKSILIMDQLEYPKVVLGQLKQWTMEGLL